MSHRIDRRDDVNPAPGVHKYSAVKFANPTNNNNLLDPPEHVRVVWSYIHHQDNADRYNGDEVTTIEKCIQ